MKAEMEDMKRQFQLQLASMQAGGLGGYVPAVQAMTDREKRELAIQIQKLPGDKLQRVLQIIQERMPLDSQVCWQSCTARRRLTRAPACPVLLACCLGLVSDPSFPTLRATLRTTRSRLTSRYWTRRRCGSSSGT